MERRNSGAGAVAATRYLLAFGILAHLVSWFSPVHDATLGYQAFAICFRLIADLGDPQAVTLWRVPAALSPHTNYLVAVAVLLILRNRSRSALKWIAVSLVLALLCNLVWMTDSSMIGHLKFGYYLWLCSFALIAGAAVSARQD
jgi:hypothetical protein